MLRDGVQRNPTFNTLRPKDHYRWLFIACATELSLGVIAWIAGFFTPEWAGASVHWDVTSFATGLAAVVPMFVLFIWMLRSSTAVLQTTRRTLEIRIRPLFEKWSIIELAIISTLAGICEELFFRELIQGTLTGFVGPHTAVLVASLVFGAFHLINAEYAIVTGLVGIYFGELWIVSGNLLAPIVTHGVYDFLALVYFLKIHRNPQRPNITELE